MFMIVKNHLYTVFIILAITNTTF